MKINYADYLKKESSLWSLGEMLVSLKIVPERKNRFGTQRLFTDAEIGAFIERMYKGTSGK